MGKREAELFFTAGTLRISFCLYNSAKEIISLIALVISLFVGSRCNSKSSGGDPYHNANPGYFLYDSISYLDCQSNWGNCHFISTARLGQPYGA